MDNLERILKALADKNRLRILKLLEKKGMCVCELAYILEVTQPSISRHLKKLASAGLIESEQDGFWTNYFIDTRNNLHTKALMKHLGARLNKDSVIKNDFKRALKINREELCRSKNSSP